MIVKIDNKRNQIALEIRRIFQASYAIEAKMLKAIDFPPLKRTISQFIDSNSEFYAYYMKQNIAGLIEISSNQSITQFRFYQDNITSISESINMSNIIYPNPTNGKITINEKDISSITLLDIYGSRVLEVKTPLDNKQININHLSDGIYLLQYIKDDIRFVNKIKLIK